jgi:hypothetical protein
LRQLRPNLRNDRRLLGHGGGWPWLRNRPCRTYLCRQRRLWLLTLASTRQHILAEHLTGVGIGHIELLASVERPAGQLHEALLKLQRLVSLLFRRDALRGQKLSERSLRLLLRL